MSDEVLDDVMIKGNCKGKADAIVNCRCALDIALTIYNCICLPLTISLNHYIV